ncbi:MAG: DNA topoisomerase [Janthinobacterium lividum]
MTGPIVVIAEKPELGKAIAVGLGGGRFADGYIDCGRHVVTWAFGHMLEFDEPSAVAWSWETLPLAVNYRKVASDGKGAQLRVIGKLLKTASGVIHAGDPDGEGQLIVDEILDWAGNTAPVRRLLVNDLNQAVVKRQLAAMKPNSEFRGLSQSAEARSRGDFVYGLNLTRAYTLAGRAQGHDGVLSVGRVQTPILGLVVRRCRAFAGHSKATYYRVSGSFAFGPLVFPAQYRVADGDPVDDAGRLSDRGHAQALAQRLSGKPARIASAKTEEKRQPPPLPYNLLALQAEASQRYGLKPGHVKDITQALREKHRLITYNRSDCQYLSDEQHGDAAAVLASIAANISELGPTLKLANPSFKGRAFDSSKVSAHHAIIPTETRADLSVLSKPERLIYAMIAKRYALQFLRPREYRQTKIEIAVEGSIFTATASVTTSPGWTEAGVEESEALDDANGEDAELTIDLALLKAGHAGVCQNAAAEEKQTKPRPLYTMATLLKKLTRVADEVKNPELRKILVGRDKGKEGEAGGIGTPATRDTMIKTLFDRGFMAEKGKAIVATSLGDSFYDALPDAARYPDMTALWHVEQEAVASGEMALDAFVTGIERFVDREIASVRARGLNITTTAPPCPLCKRPLRRIKGKKGIFWSCTGREDGCTFTADDKGGKPSPRKSAGVRSDIHTCPACAAPLVRRPSAKHKGKFWWSCSGYPSCKHTFLDRNNAPAFETGRS